MGRRGGGTFAWIALCVYGFKVPYMAYFQDIAHKYHDSEGVWAFQYVSHKNSKILYIKECS